MLREVCDACGKVIDGTPTERSEPDATLLMGDEVVMMYEALCPSCSERLKLAVRDFKTDKTVEKTAPLTTTASHGMAGTASVAEDVVYTTTASNTRGDVTAPESTETVETVPKDMKTENPPQKASHAPVDKESLPNQVTRQFPINLPTHHSGSEG